MPYWMRVFCRKSAAPTPGEILEALSTAKLPAQLDPEADIEPSDPHWEQTAFVIAGDGGLLVVDRDVGPRGEAVVEEVAEFLLQTRRSPSSKARDRIVEHLKDTKQVFCLQVPTSSIDPTGWAVAHAVMRFLVASCDGLVHADGEGFYHGNDLVLELA
jgi:hypothetical protein